MDEEEGGRSWKSVLFVGVVAANVLHAGFEAENKLDRKQRHGVTPLLLAKLFALCKLVGTRET